MDKKYYLGPLLVESVTDVEGFKTNGGNPVVEVKLANGFKQMMPKNAYEQMVIDSPEKDLTKFTDKYLDLVAGEVLAVLAEHHITGENIDMLFRTISGNLVESFNRADHKVWVGDDCLYTPRGNALMERSVLEAEYILRGNDKE